MCLAIGGYKHPDDLLRELTATQWKEWELYHAEEPWGEVQQFYQTGIIASTLVNLQKKKGSQPCSATEFMPYYKEKKKVQTGEEMRDALLSILTPVKSDKNIIVKKREKD